MIQRLFWSPFKNYISGLVFNSMEILNLALKSGSKTFFFVSRISLESAEGCYCRGADTPLYVALYRITVVQEAFKYIPKFQSLSEMLLFMLKEFQKDWQSCFSDFIW